MTELLNWKNQTISSGIELILKVNTRKSFRHKENNK